MKKTIILLILFLIETIPSLVLAAIYRWEDENGQTHYGEKAPATNALEIQIKEMTIDESMDKHNKNREKLLRIYEEERNIKKEEKIKAEKLKAEKEQQCQNLVTEMTNLRQGGHVYYEQEENGDRKYLSEEEVSAYIKKIQKSYETYCK